MPNCSVPCSYFSFQKNLILKESAYFSKTYYDTAYQGPKVRPADLLWCTSGLFTATASYVTDHFRCANSWQSAICQYLRVTEHFCASSDTRSFEIAFSGIQDALNEAVMDIFVDYAKCSVYTLKIFSIPIDVNCCLLPEGHQLYYTFLKSQSTAGSTPSKIYLVSKWQYLSIFTSAWDQRKKHSPTFQQSKAIFQQ